VHRLDGAQIRHKRSLKRRIMKPFLLGFPRGKVLFHFTCNVKIKNTFSLIKFYRLFIRSLTHSFNCSDFSLSSFLHSIYFFQVFYCFLLLFDSSSFLILTFVANFAYLIFFNYDFVHFHDGYMNTNNTQQIIDSNQFVGDIYIKPARSINFIQLNFVAVATGVDFTTVVGVV
jgi:hypothetical protein